ncbi:hypothetical protein K431DRAFT_141573 [Polychaeton citri CBS 116435]|uniref:Uncharacterized protein n=1 Tax=Polychaeton citri CBS 116435 TaxID=1314669 RepID=A0A9P4Q048_9PEZI|nr:hypothetical protein K431DRAFT_141573 [Polychaeton citri CBS 116435]
MMFIPILLFLSARLALAAPGCAGGVYASIGSELAWYSPVQSYCSSKYPVPTVTSTVTAPTKTLTKTTSTATVVTTATTGYVTVTPITTTATVYTTTNVVTSYVTTSTATQVETTTTTTTVTVTAAAAKKRAKRNSGNTSSASSKWSSVQAKMSTAVAKICTCLETAKTTTVTTTPLTTKSVVATATSSVTATSTVSKTATAIVSTDTATTISITSVTTSTTTTTSTATSTYTYIHPENCTPDPNSFSKSCGPSSDCNCFPTVEHTGPGGYCALSTAACGRACNIDSDCGAGNACLANSGTNCGYNSCTDGADAASCPNPSSTKLLFGRRVKRPARIATLEGRAVKYRDPPTPEDV